MTERKGSSFKYEEMEELRRGPWTLEEDTLLIHYIACHGEGRWNLLARCSGLKRTGKSCRLRWLNYLKPDIKRGNLSPEEQLLILELHSKWGNRWSRIAQHLPGRTDNEIKNYWRTRVQKQARQLKVDANSALFRDAVRCYWIPRLLDRKMGCSSSSTSSTRQALDAATTVTATENLATNTATVMQALDQGPYLCYNDASMQYDLPLDQFPVVAESELPSRSIDEFDGVTSNPASSGYSSMNDAYQGLDEAWDPALTSSSPTPTSDHLATNLASLWSMDELYDILQSTL